MIRPVTLLILTISLIYLVNCANKWPALFFFLLGVLFRKAFKSAFCFLTPRCSGTSCWVGSPLPSSGQLRPRATRQNNISQFIAPASWFMCKKQDNLGCYYFTGTHTHGNAHSAWMGHGGIFVCHEWARAVHAPFTHMHTHIKTVSVIRPGSCCCVRSNYSMQLSGALMETFRLTGSTVRSLGSASF